MAQKPTFQRAQEYLTEQINLGPVIKRVGVVLNANLDSAIDVGRRLDDVIQSALEKVEAAIERKLADFSDVNQRRTIEFFYAQSRRTPAATQVGMLIEGKDSSSVALAAAQQRKVPEPVQFALVEHCSRHSNAMRALAANPETRPSALWPLIEHPDFDVRQVVAAHIGNRMRVDEISINSEKQSVYNAIVDVYEGEFAEYLVPVCRDPKQIQQMFDQTPMTPSNARLFVENPYSPDGVLLDIVSSTTTRLMPGGGNVLEDAKNLLENRLNRAEGSSAPEM